jgi:hypothetical protein
MNQIIFEYMLERYLTPDAHWCWLAKPVWTRPGR